ncbi:hypothetical protein ACQPXM_28370 [Kribbella sp. CA-253562]|uniref:hypothetical protein n=1 Tax=Kribbella sp. CA-253562 TaxID=3239942 RepID=UPI003D93954C
MHARVAWLLAALTVVLSAADVWVTSAYRPLLSEETVTVHGFPFVTAAVVGCATMGALIVARYRRHPIGWLLCLIGVLSSFSLLAEAYSIWVVTADGPGTRALGGIAGWLSVLVGGQLALGALAILFLLAPDGHLLSRRWGVAAVATLTGLACYTAGLLTVSPTGFDLETRTPNDLGSRLLQLGILLIAGGLVAATVSMFVRLRRSQGEQRQQLRLIAAAVLLVAGGFVLLLVVELINGGKQTWIASLPLYIAYPCLPLLFAVAVLRYRLYHLELILNRAVVLALGTGFAALGYTGLVLAVAALVNTRTSGFWVSLAAISLVALAFQPLRRRVVRFANRLAYGEKAQPYEALSDFSGRLAETPTPGALLPAVAAAAAQAVSARSSTVVLRVAGAEPIVERWPDGVVTAVEYDVPVRHEGELLGSIGVTMPKGRKLRAADQRLLHDLADQTALAFRNAAMESELAAHVAVLDRTTVALAESRRRIVAADDFARCQLEAAIVRDVLSHLESMPAQLDTLSVVASGPAATDQLVRLVGRTNAALEALRELTRGVFPTQLIRSGLARTLGSHLSRSGPAITLAVEPSADRRFPARVEAAIYFCCVEAVRARSTAARIDLGVVGTDMVLRVGGISRDDIDVQAILDRVEAAGGSLAPVEPRVLSLSIPVEDAAPVAV